MGIVKNDEIVAYRVAGEIVCDTCISSEEVAEVTEEEIIVESERKDDLIFCDRCKERC